MINLRQDLGNVIMALYPPLCYSYIDAYSIVADNTNFDFKYNDIVLYSLNCNCLQTYDFDYELLMPEFFNKFTRLNIINDVDLSILGFTNYSDIEYNLLKNVNSFIHSFEILFNVDYVSNYYIKQFSDCSFTTAQIPLGCYLSFSRSEIVDKDLVIYLGIFIDYPLRYKSCLHNKIDDVAKFTIKDFSSLIQLDFTKLGVLLGTRS